jgi:hypothetical protein
MKNQIARYSLDDVETSKERNQSPDIHYSHDPEVQDYSASRSLLELLVEIQQI